MGNELTMEKLPFLPARIKRAGKPSGFKNAETQMLVSMTTATGIGYLSDIRARYTDFSLDLLGCIVAGSPMDFLQQLFQRSPACQAALRLVGRQGTPVLVLLEGNHDRQWLPLLLQNERLLQIRNSSAVGGSSF
jgi:hypothetical protein